MVKITPNCFECDLLEKVTEVTKCGVVIHFHCFNKFFRIYGNPELVICDDWEKKKEA